MPIVRKIAPERRRLGLSRQALAQALGVSPASLRAYEADGNIPAGHLRSMALLFGVSAEYLLGFAEPAKAQQRHYGNRAI